MTVAGIGGTLITLAPRAVELPLLLRLALDAEQVGATRIQLPADLDRPEQAITALRHQTRLLISADPPIPADLLDLVVLADGAVQAAGRTVALELRPDPELDATAQIAYLSQRIGAAELPVSVACHGPAAVPALLTALAAGAHVRVGTAGSVADDGQRADVNLVARAAGIARLIGRPPLSLVQARSLLRLG